MTQERLNDEYRALIELLGLSDRELKFKDFNTDNPYLLVAQMTNSGIVYTIKIELSGFPNNVPDVYITNPKPLRTRSGESMLEANPFMHTLTGKDGCVRVCHYGPRDWNPNVSLYQIVLKIRVWLEIYEEHLVTGKPLDYCLTHARVNH